MGTTPIYALPYPEPADTPDVPRDIKALAEKLDTVLGTLGGGGSTTLYVARSTANLTLSTAVQDVAGCQVDVIVPAGESRNYFALVLPTVQISKSGDYRVESGMKLGGLALPQRALARSLTASNVWLSEAQVYAGAMAAGSYSFTLFGQLVGTVAGNDAYLLYPHTTLFVALLPPPPALSTVRTPEPEDPGPYDYLP